MCNYCYGSESTHNKMGRITITTPECKHISICAGYGKAQPIKQVTLITADFERGKL